MAETIILTGDPEPEAEESTAETLAVAGELAEQLDEARQEGKADAIGEALSLASVMAGIEALGAQVAALRSGQDEWNSKQTSWTESLEGRLTALETVETVEHLEPEASAETDVLQVETVGAAPESSSSRKGRRRTLHLF